jgi:molecular chaperone DnaK
MVKEAEEHAAEDRQRREEVDARNELDAFAHRVERQLEELGDRVPAHQREQAESLVRDARRAIDEGADLDRVRPLTSDLQQMVQALQSAGATSGPADGGDGDGEGKPAAEEEEVVDAEFTRE